MKRHISLILGGIVALSAISPALAFADDGSVFTASSGGVMYKCSVDPNGKTAQILSAFLPGNITEATVPAEINGYKITSLGNKAYIGNLQLEKIVIPSHIYSIGSQAFMSCNELKEVVIGDGITEIPDDCFFSCPKLVTVELPDSLLRIGNEAFFGCNELDITIPPSVVSIGSGAVGFHADSQSFDSITVRGFLIKGTAGSSAEAYAKENGIDFIDLNDFIAGDVNNDGMTDASDASDVLSEYARLSTGSPSLFTKRQLITGDLNGDDSIDSSDASKILEIYAKSLTT